MTELLVYVITGVTAGSLYSLIGMGLVLSYRTSGVINLAYGAVATVAAYTFYDLRELQGLSWPVAFVLTLILIGVAGGFLLERMCSVLVNASVVSRVAAVAALLIGLVGYCVWRYGGDGVRVPTYLPDNVYRVASVGVRADQIIVIVFGLLSAIGLYAFFRRARSGIAMRAVVDDAELMALRAINPMRVRLYASVVGTSFAAISGMLLAPQTVLDANILTVAVVTAFGAAAVGRFSNLPATYVGGIAIGVASALLSGYLPSSSTWAQALPSNLPFLVLLVVLLVTPKDRLLTLGRELPRLSTSREAPALVRHVATGAVIVIAIALPFISPNDVNIFTTGCVYLLLFASLSLLIGQSGQVSLCHMAFAAVGATTSAHAVAAGLPWAVAVLLAGLAAIPVSLIVLIPAIRLSGIYLAVATFGLQLLIQNLFYQLPWMFGELNFQVAPRPEWGPLAGDRGYYYLVLAVGACGVLAVSVIRRARLGQLLRAMAEAPAAVNSHGTNTAVTRTIVFIISALLAGVAGAFMGPVSGFVGSSSFGYQASLNLVVVAYLVGREPVRGPIMGALFLGIIPSYITNSTVLTLLPMLFGLAALQAAIMEARRQPRLRKRVAESPAVTRVPEGAGRA